MAGAVQGVGEREAAREGKQEAAAAAAAAAADARGSGRGWVCRPCGAKWGYAARVRRTLKEEMS